MGGEDFRLTYDIDFPLTENDRRAVEMLVAGMRLSGVSELFSRVFRFGVAWAHLNGLGFDLVLEKASTRERIFLVLDQRFIADDYERLAVATFRIEVPWTAYNFVSELKWRMREDVDHLAVRRSLVGFKHLVVATSNGW